MYEWVVRANTLHCADVATQQNVCACLRHAAHLEMPDEAQQIFEVPQLRESEGCLLGASGLTAIVSGTYMDWWDELGSSHVAEPRH